MKTSGFPFGDGANRADTRLCFPQTVSSADNGPVKASPLKKIAREEYKSCFPFKAPTQLDASPANVEAALNSGQLTVGSGQQRPQPSTTNYQPTVEDKTIPPQNCAKPSVRRLVDPKQTIPHFL